AHAHCAPPRGGGAETPHHATLDGLEELALEPFGKEPDLVQEQRAGMGDLEEAGLRLAGIGEGAPLESKQLRLEQRLGDGRAVDVDERARSPCARPVNQMSE